MAHVHASPTATTPSEVRAAERRALSWMVSLLIPVALATLVSLVWLWPRGVSAHLRPDASTVMVPGVTLPKGTVTMVNQIPCDGQPGSVANDSRPCAQLQVHLDEGPEAGQVTSVPMTAAVYASGVRAGDHVRLYRTPAPGNESQISYQFADFVRGVPLLVFGALFVLAVVAVARWRGLLSLVGLGFAAVVIWKFLLPGLVVGHNPVLVGLTACSAIMFVVLYTAHGFSTRTTTALVGTLFGLVVSAALGVWATRWAHLSGVASEDDFLLTSAAPDLRLHQVVMCGIIIAGLGVLNDVTITQASAVWELAGERRSARDLFAGAMRIGRDHIASTVYTTAFATAGAILTTLLLLNIYQRPLVEVATSEQFAGELVRTLVGSIGLVLAVPATTAIAVLAVAGARRPRADVLRPGATAAATAQASPATPAARRPARAAEPSDAAPTPAPAQRRPRRNLRDDDAFRRPTGPDEV